MRLDVPGANRDQLILAGVREENIHVCGLCTAMHLDVLTSYRAEKEDAGRIAGVIRASVSIPPIATVALSQFAFHEPQRLFDVH